MVVPKVALMGEMKVVWLDFGMAEKLVFEKVVWLVVPRDVWKVVE